MNNREDDARSCFAFESDCLGKLHFIAGTANYRWIISTNGLKQAMAAPWNEPTLYSEIGVDPLTHKSFVTGISLFSETGKKLKQ